MLAVLFVLGLSLYLTTFMLVCILMKILSDSVFENRRKEKENNSSGCLMGTRKEKKQMFYLMMH